MFVRALFFVLLTISIVFGFADVAVQANQAWHDHKDHTQVSDQFNSEAGKFTSAMETGMKKMMVDMHRPGMTGNPDVDFLAMMIPHHEGAVEMGRLVLLYGKDPLVRQLAFEIITSQQVEIAAMQARLLVLRRGADPNPDGFPAIDGTRGKS
ncbi:DUF305 domain-containing protein [Pelatocladus sp. BLCC-F211]|uniref:DUF305 domain-containing protein n=1 Tax=Pelatocladus sp. BLCC-F211 TaxID=3342752 RepID=UPI0035BC538D